MSDRSAASRGTASQSSTGTAPAAPAGQDYATVGYLGPAGTFCEAALLTVAERLDSRLQPMPNVNAAIAGVRAGSLDAAMVPMENSIEGSVSATLDELGAGAPLVITHEVVIPVSFALLVRPGTDRDGVRRIVTHPHAEAQTRPWVQRNLPQAVVVPATSTAAAAQMVSDASLGYDAAIAAPIAGARYGLESLAERIETTHAFTRFVLVARPGRPPAPTGGDKSTFVVFMHRDRAGALLEILEQFAVRGVNLTRIESRPVGARLGDYCFSIDCEGHIAEERVGEALMGLKRICADVRFLGSYPRADGQVTAVAPATADADFVAARAWLRGLRGTPA